MGTILRMTQPGISILHHPNLLGMRRGIEDKAIRVEIARVTA
jgi:hypothetical protein